MTQPLVALNVIVRDDAERFKNMLKTAVEYVDEVIVGIDSRSEEGGSAILAALADVVPPGKRIETFSLDWQDDFAYARNLVLDRTTAQTMLWLDSDDMLVGGERLREKCQELLDTPDAAGVLLFYDYSFDQHGNVIHSFTRERIVRLSDGWRWRSRVHETLASTVTQTKPRWLLDRQLRVLHGGIDHPRDERNMKLLTMQLADSVPAELWAAGNMAEIVQQTDDPRTLLYLGNQHYSGGRPDEAIFFYTAFARWPRYAPGRSILKPEHWIALRQLGELYQRQRKYAEALTTYTQAEMLYPRWPDSWMGKADVMLAMGRPEDAEVYAQQAIAFINEGSLPDPMVFANHVDYKVVPCIQMAKISEAMGDLDAALHWTENGLKVQPDNDLLAEWATAYRVAIRESAEAEAAVTLLEGLLRTDDPIRANNLYLELPRYLYEHPRVRDLGKKANGQVQHLLSKEAYEAYYQQNPGWFPTPDEGLVAWQSFARFKAIADMVGEDKTVLDLGSADGILHPMLADLGSTITAVDIDFRCLKEARDRAARLGYADRLAVQQGMAEAVLEQLREDGWRFDVAVLGELLEHVIDPQALLDKAEMVADRVVITVPDEAFDQGEIEGWDTHDPRGHVRTFTRDSLAETLLDRSVTALTDYRPPRRVMELFHVRGGGNRGWLAAAYELGPAEGKDIVIYCGPGLERWSPLNVRWTGIGGSETAVVRTAAELAKQGHRVRVYAEADGVWDGVHYKRYEDASPMALGMSDLLVLWRSPDALRLGLVPDDYDGKVALWLHDVDCGDRLTPELAQRIDYILYLSEWHKEHLLERYPWLTLFPPDAGIYPQLVRTWNGIDDFDVSGIEREPHRLMWASSPDRGLDVILENWDKIREVWPDATLHAFYGWENIEKFAAFNPSVLDLKKRIEPLLKQDGVFWHGRVNARELRQEWAKSSIFFYAAPKSGFAETFCLSVGEAQAAGCVPVVNSNGALPETTGSGGIILNTGDPATSVEQFLSLMKTVLSDENQMEALRQAGRENAKRFTWKQVAESFANLVGEPVVV